METTIPDLTFRDYSLHLEAEVSQAPSFVPHTCDYCTKLLIKCPSLARDPSAINCHVEGLSLELIYLGAAGGCPLYTEWLQHPDWDNFNEASNWRFTFRISHRSTFMDATGQLVKQGDDTGFETLLRALDDDGVEFFDFTPRYSVSLGEGSSTPSWLGGSQIWGKSAASEEQFVKARSWFRECHHTDTHQQCDPTPTDFVPSRLISIPRDDQASHIEIVGTSQLGFVPWCALSYCWGGPQPTQTTSSNYNFDEDRRIMPLLSLPRTILDAVYVASKLGVPYIWVDSLCIIQGDQEDLQKELPCMPKIYKHAVLTIVASAATNSSQGFLRPRNYDTQWDSQPVSLRCVDEYGNDGAIVLNDFGVWRMQKTVEPIDSRAWTLQERILSPRALVFDSSTISWICLSHTYSETDLQPTQRLHMSLLLKESKNFFQKNGQDPVFSWAALVTQYSQRKLSFTSDKLIAIAAIAEEFGAAQQWDYVAGLWRQGIQTMAAWFYDDSIGNRRPGPDDYRAPSWSWASVNSEQRVWMLTPLKVPFPDIIDVVAEPALETFPFGNAKSGYMTVQCRAVSVYLRREPDRLESLTLRKDDGEQAFSDHQRDSLYRMYLDAPQDDFPGWEMGGDWEVYLLKLSSDNSDGRRYGLMLKVVSAAEDIYQRVGLYGVSFDPENLEIFEGIVPRKLTIV